MQFNSYSYCLLLLSAVGIFWLLPQRIRKVYVLLLSVGFYATWSPVFILVPILLAAGVYLCAAKMLAEPNASRRWFWAGIVYSLSFLVFFRYHQLWATAAFSWLHIGHQSAAGWINHIVAPLGISFYTFEAISYLIDVSQGRIKKISYLDLYLFLMFWPHLIAGPIVRFRELAPQFSFAKNFELAMLVQGLDRLILGLVQKNLIADNLGQWVDEGFLPHASILNSTTDNWFLALAFGLQIYFDFASYSNMAIGAAKLIGIDLPENFRFPYHAKNPADFWARWHMTLSRWIRDYLFFPVNVRFQGAPLPLYASLLAIMALVGVWHGVGWGFVIWGVWHGVLLASYRMWEGLEAKRPTLAGSALVERAIQLGTIIAIFAAWIPFRAGSLSQVLQMFRTMFLSFNPHISYSLNFYLATILVAAYCVMEPWLNGLITRADDACRNKALLWRSNIFGLRPFIYACGLLLFLIFDERNTQFIYFQF